MRFQQFLKRNDYIYPNTIDFQFLSASPVPSYTANTKYISQSIAEELEEQGEAHKRLVLEYYH